jgi:hypothetical protein
MSGIESVTFSSGGRSVTLTAPDARRGIATIDRMESARALIEGTPENENRDLLLKAIEAAPGIVAKQGSNAAGLDAIAGLLEDLPPYLRAPDYAELLDLDVQPIVDMLIEQCEEHADLAGHPIRLTWRVKHPSKSGKIVRGSCKVVSARERLTWLGDGPPPWWEITLSLDVWLLLTQAERIRLVHHEMMHAMVDVDADGHEKPAMRPHDVEEFVATVGRFGPGSREALVLADHLLSHPSVAERRIEWKVDAFGQGFLFDPFVADAG